MRGIGDSPHAQRRFMKMSEPGVWPVQVTITQGGELRNVLPGYAHGCARDDTERQGDSPQSRNDRGFIAAYLPS